MRNSITNDDLADVISTMFSEGLTITDEYGDTYSGDSEGDVSWIMLQLHRERPSEKPVEEMYKGFDEEWIGRKMREKVEEHCRLYPNFSFAVDYIKYALDLQPKVQRWEAYQPIAKWSKSRRKTVSFEKFAESQS